MHLVSKAKTPLEFLVRQYLVEIPNESLRTNIFVCRRSRSLLFAINIPSGTLLCVVEGVGDAFAL